MSTGIVLASPLSVLSTFSAIGDMGAEKALVLVESPWKRCEALTKDSLGDSTCTFLSKRYIGFMQNFCNLWFRA